MITRIWVEGYKYGKCLAQSWLEPTRGGGGELPSAGCTQIDSLCLTGGPKCESCTIQTVELQLCASVFTCSDSGYLERRKVLNRSYFVCVLRCAEDGRSIGCNLVSFRHFEETFFEMSVASYPGTQRHIPEHWTAFNYLMNVTEFSKFELHTAVFWDVKRAGIDLPQSRTISISSNLRTLEVTNSKQTFQ